MVNVTAHRISFLTNARVLKNVTGHKIPVRTTAIVTTKGLLTTEFPFPLLTKSGEIIKTENNFDISIDGNAIAVLLINGVVSPQSLHVTTED